MAEVKRKSQGTRAPVCTIQQPSANLLRVTLVNTTDIMLLNAPRRYGKSRGPQFSHRFAAVLQSKYWLHLVTLKGWAAKDSPSAAVWC